MSTPVPSSRSARSDYAVMVIAAIGVVAALIAIGFAISATMAASDEQAQTLDLVERSVERGVENALLRTAAGAPEGSAAAVVSASPDLVAAPAGMDDPLADVIPEFTPKAQLEPTPADEVNVSYAPDVPARATRTDQRIVDVSFEVVENVVSIDPATGLEFETWGYKVAGDDEVVTGAPGPMIRARVGDVLRFTIINPVGNTHPHNVDFHAVTGQGGGAEDTVVAPGETAVIEARLLYPGLYMYHCAYGDVPVHIARGMYGGILVDPATPLPDVDLELYMVQSEFYTDSTEPGLADLDTQALLDEEPSVVVFNGSKGSMTGDNAPVIQVGERRQDLFRERRNRSRLQLPPHWFTLGRRLPGSLVAESAHSGFSNDPCPCRRGYGRRADRSGAVEHHPRRSCSHSSVLQGSLGRHHGRG